ncbi:trichohyalin-like [Strongylocentrotus purpuratus]|uniref:Uncharacterized protein n=1 Tax=Strongylocentrotus purpuratus TaxID=7668 RepID=A0A7M7N8G0_STRPU|nr:trichohyalin-like [Strongylocentrotus purpuratus]
MEPLPEDREPLPEERESFQPRSDSFKEEGHEQKFQLKKTPKQRQEPEESFTVEDQEGGLEWDDEIKPLEEEREPLEEEREPLEEERDSFQPRSDSFKEERHEQKFQLRTAPKQRQVLGEKIQVIRKKADPEKRHPDCQAEKQDDLSTQLEEANQKYQDLDKEFDILLEEKLEFQSLADNLADDNYKLSTELGQAYTERHVLEDKLDSLEAEGEEQELATKLKEENKLLSTSLGSMRNLIKHLQEEVEILSENNEKLRQETTSVESQLEDGLFEELEKNTALCQILEQKVAAAEGEKAEFEEETLKWEKDRADLLTQLQNSQTQYQILKDQFESVSQDGKNRHVLASKLIEEKEELCVQLEDSRKECQESDVRLDVIPKATKILDQKIAYLQTDRKELRRKLETAEKERLDFSEQNKVAMEKFKEAEELRLNIEEKNTILEYEIKLAKNKVADYKADNKDLNVHNRGLKHQIEFQKKSNEELEGRAFTLVEMLDLLEKKVFLAENRQKQLEGELQVRNIPSQYGYYNFLFLHLKKKSQQMDKSSRTETRLSTNRWPMGRRTKRSNE